MLLIIIGFLEVSRAAALNASAGLQAAGLSNQWRLIKRAAIITIVRARGIAAIPSPEAYP